MKVCIHPLRAIAALAGSRTPGLLFTRAVVPLRLSLQRGAGPRCELRDHPRFLLHFAG